VVEGTVGFWTRVYLFFGRISIGHPYQVSTMMPGRGMAASLQTDVCPEISAARDRDSNHRRRRQRCTIFTWSESGAYMGYYLRHKWATINGFGRKWVAPAQISNIYVRWPLCVYGLTRVLAVRSSGSEKSLDGQPISQVVVCSVSPSVPMSTGGCYTVTRFCQNNINSFRPKRKI